MSEEGTWLSPCPHSCHWEVSGGSPPSWRGLGSVPPIPTRVPTRVSRALAALEAALAEEEEEGDVPTRVLVEHEMVRPQNYPRIYLQHPCMPHSCPWPPHLPHNTSALKLLLSPLSFSQPPYLTLILFMTPTFIS